MRKSLASLIALTLVVGALAAPAAAGKKKGKHVHETISATLAPFPKLAAADPTGTMKPGCTAGQADVHYRAVPFTAPGKGTLKFTLEGFEGDWDIYIWDAEGNVLFKGENAQIDTADPTGGAAPEEEILMPMTKGQEIQLVMCNWASPTTTVEATYMGTFK